MEESMYKKTNLEPAPPDCTYREPDFDSHHNPAYPGALTLIYAWWITRIGQGSLTLHLGLTRKVQPHV